MQELIIQTKDLTKIYRGTNRSRSCQHSYKTGKDLWPFRPKWCGQNYDYENDDGPYPYNEGRN